MNANRTLIVMAAVAAGTLGWARSTDAAVGLLANPGFENGAGGGSLAGWSTFGNAVPEGTPNSVPTHSGDGVAKQYGNFWGPGAFNVTGVYQKLPATPGATYALDVFTYQAGNDSLVGKANWAVAKVAFFDAADQEIPGAFNEVRVMDGTFAVDTWIDNPAATAVAPANAVQVGAYLMFLQPNNEGGAVLFDDASLSVVPEPASLGLVGTVASLALARRRRSR